MEEPLHRVMLVVVPLRHADDQDAVFCAPHERCTRGRVFSVRTVALHFRTGFDSLCPLLNLVLFTVDINKGHGLLAFVGCLGVLVG